ncbi:MAG: hypothetical protein KIPDCIKN_03689 [Haliscomenobacter sp.]|nr:hypothetical protein [Haliscomenobacter sp.]
MPAANSNRKTEIVKRVGIRSSYFLKLGPRIIALEFEKISRTCIGLPIHVVVRSANENHVFANRNRVSKFVVATEITGYDRLIQGPIIESQPFEDICLAIGAIFIWSANDGISPINGHGISKMAAAIRIRGNHFFDLGPGVGNKFKEVGRPGIRIAADIVSVGADNDIRRIDGHRKAELVPNGPVRGINFLGLCPVIQS